MAENLGKKSLDIFSVSDEGKVAPSQKMVIGETEPDLKSVSPAPVFWGRNKANAVGWIAEVGLPAGQTLAKPLRPFDAQILAIFQNAGKRSNERFALMGLELIATTDEMSLGGSIWTRRLLCSATSASVLVSATVGLRSKPVARGR